jgi:hypothetical protein
MRELFLALSVRLQKKIGASECIPHDPIAATKTDVVAQRASFNTTMSKLRIALRSDPMR